MWPHDLGGFKHFAELINNYHSEAEHRQRDTQFKTNCYNFKTYLFNNNITFSTYLHVKRLQENYIHIVVYI